MYGISFTTALARLVRKLFRGATRRLKHVSKKTHSPISILNDDVLLHIFYILRLHIEDEQETYEYSPIHSHRWWYRLAHVSRRWRRVILAAPSLLDLHLVCTHVVSVADMLAHSPLLPLTIFYRPGSAMTTEDQKGALLALSHRDRVHRIVLHMQSWELEKLFVAMDEQFPVLERLNIVSSTTEDEGLEVTLPQTFGAPHLSHIKLINVSLPIRCPLLTTTGLVSLRLGTISRSAYFPPSYLLTSLALMPQLESMWIIFYYPIPSREVRDTATTPFVTLPNLRDFEFWGVSAYLEGLCTRMTAPVLSVFRVDFFNQLTFSVPRLSSFMQTSENLQYHAVKLVCSDDSVCLEGDPQPSTWKYPLNLRIWCRHLDWQISSAIQILDALSPVLSVVEQVTLIMNGDGSSECHNDVDRTQWRGLFRSFNNVKKLHVETKLVRGQDLGHSLRTEDGDLPLELLPNLEEVTYSGSDDENAFTPFINEREAVGRPVRLTMQSRYFWSGNVAPHPPDIMI